jgi:twitching motility protein PilT
LQPVPTRGLSRLSPYQTELIALHLLQGNRESLRKLVETGSVDVPYGLAGRTRFRVNIFLQRGTYCVVLRVIPSGVPSLESLGMPAELAKVADLRNGLVLVTGPTGSGKSTTLAAMINEINQRHAYHVVTIEDPVEFLHRHGRCTINQREVGVDTPTFALALRAALRQAPKVILVGEMRDAETAETAIEAAETGHLVLSTLHTVDAAKTVERILGIFPKEDETSIRMRFAQAFRYVVSQRLAPRCDRDGRVAIMEILKSTARTREYVLKGSSDGRSLVDAMHDGMIDGMQHFDYEIVKLIRQGVLSKEVGLSFATNPHDLALQLGEFGQDPVAAGAGETLPDWLE